MRWWDGGQWTEHVAPAAAPAPLRVAGLEPHAEPAPEPPNVVLVAAPVHDAVITPTRRNAWLGRLLFAVVCVVLVSIGAIAFGGGPAETKLVHAFRSTDAAMTVSLPGSPTHEQLDQQVMGYTLPVDMYTVELPDERGGIMVATFDFDALIEQLPADKREAARSAADANSMLSDGAKAAAANVEGRVERGKLITVGGFPAYDAKIERSEPGVADMRIVYVPSTMKMYVLVVVTEHGDDALFARVAATMQVQAAPAPVAPAATAPATI